MEQWIQEVAEYLVKNWQSLPEYNEVQNENSNLGYTECKVEAVARIIQRKYDHDLM